MKLGQILQAKEAERALAISNKIREAANLAKSFNYKGTAKILDDFAESLIKPMGDSIVKFPIVNKSVVLGLPPTRTVEQVNSEA